MELLFSICIIPCNFASNTVRFHLLFRGFPGGSDVKNLPAKQEMQVWSLGQEDPLEKEMEIHSSILAWEIPQTEEAGGLQFMGTKESNTT